MIGFGCIVVLINIFAFSILLSTRPAKYNYKSVINMFRNHKDQMEQINKAMVDAEYEGYGAYMIRTSKALITSHAAQVNRIAKTVKLAAKRFCRQKTKSA